MSNAFNRENRYLVLKHTDIACISEAHQRLLKTVADNVANYRAKNGKKPLNCVVVEEDWPEFESVWQSIEMRNWQAETTLPWEAPVVADAATDYTIVAPILSWVDIKDLGVKGRITSARIVVGSIWYVVEYWLDGRLIEVELQAADLQVRP